MDTYAEIERREYGSVFKLFDQLKKLGDILVSDFGFERREHNQFAIVGKGSLQIAVHYEPEDGERGICLRGLWADELRRGFGREVLTKALQAVDKLGIELFITPRPFDLDMGKVTYGVRQGAMNERQLTAWYQRFGFFDLLSGRMARLQS